MQARAIGTAPAGAPADSNPLGDYSYSYYQDGQKATESAKNGTAAAKVTSYGYDPMGRLETVAFPDATSRRYCFDLDSNRTRYNTSTSGDCTTGTPGATYSYSATSLDELSSVTQGTAVTNYSYNGDGDVTGRGSDTFSWDVRDRLTGATLQGRTISYEYDPAGFMHKRSITEGYLGTVLDSQPSNYWRLGETTGTTATDLVGGKNGTYTGGVTLNQTGALGGSGDSNPAVSFNGTTGWITTPVTLTTAQLSNFTLEAWVNFSTVPSTPETVVGIAGSIKLQITGGGLGHVQLVYVDAGGTTHTYAHVNPMFPIGWHHISVGYRPGGRVEIELDGVMTDFSGAPAPAGNSNTLSIGHTTGTSDWYAGQIDDVSLYTHDLSSLERQNHNTRGLNTPATSSAYYRFGGLEETSDTASTPNLTDADVDAPDGTDLVHDTWDPAGGDSANNFLYYNGHGDLAVETDNTGTVEDTHTYDPFGAPLDSILTNNSDIAPTGTTERYTGSWDKKTDDSTGLIEMGARSYDPALGRFYSVDPISGGSLNNYDYAAQDPVNGYDLNGLSLPNELSGADPALVRLPNDGTSEYDPATGPGEGGDPTAGVSRPPTSAEARAQAQKLNYGDRVKDPGFNSHGQPVFSNGKNFISPDRDMHQGQWAWKMFTRNGRRLGTYSWSDLTRLGK